MANFNTLIKRKQYIWLGLILAGGRGSRRRRAVSVRSEHEL
ncbi:conjugal transfer pilus assembly protein [Klebsiella pneumoniae subsp. pneumoniae KpMDU1]|nr:conjugal transfer pilus assembly protein [Klebsiella pneumoniae subsp. pneumoniae KpMDU1]